ncbi:SDR family NAD(P)-dependent oxidoreductase [Asticcacaulis sp.]|uniref:SDR family NAD(P)-dependent oxidoreductase n=1 Tax=Asticcacaulis sp. TaxID=1872648 RepID=UPI003F7C2E26
MTTPSKGNAILIGASGGIGGALLTALIAQKGYDQVLPLSRSSAPPLDLLNEESIAEAASWAASQGDIRLVIDATGFLHDAQFQPEKSWKHLDPAHMARAFAINAAGPALLMKHFLPLLPREGRSVFALLSARVGSIGDNELGGWYSYRASKAALNQFVRTAAIELRRRAPQAICVSLHPGTVETALSSPFHKTGLAVRPPAEAALALLGVINGLQPDQSGGFYDYTGQPLPW